jgi:ElaB/YqjD/DUF883 family membrane-anchored ribosome-binding protein
MIDPNSQQEQRLSEPLRSSATNERLMRGVHAVGESAQRAETAIKTHPYFAVGVLAGVGLAVGGALVLRAHRRRSFADVVMGLF